MANKHRVVIIGGGFGGLGAALQLKHAPVDVTLVDRCNYHLFQPLLYQVATGTLSPANIASPLRTILKSHKNTRVILGEAVRIDAASRQVILSDGAIPYDTLVIATGSSHQYFGHDEWERFAPGLKTVETPLTCAGEFFWLLKRPNASRVLKNWKH
jgi:NADH dehydrogenase